MPLLRRILPAVFPVFRQQKKEQYLKIMGPALRAVRLIQIAMLVSIAMYVCVGELFGRSQAPKPTVFVAISFVSISIVGAIMLVRRTLVSPCEVVLKDKPDDAATLARWRQGYIVTYALCESLALFALMLRFLGFQFSQVWPFYIGGFALLLVLAPRRPQADLDPANGPLTGG
jgi:hypothetical protein